MRVCVVVLGFSVGLVLCGAVGFDVRLVLLVRFGCVMVVVWVLGFAFDVLWCGCGFLFGFAIVG